MTSVSTEQLSVASDKVVKIYPDTLLLAIIPAQRSCIENNGNTFGNGVELPLRRETPLPLMLDGEFERIYLYILFFKFQNLSSP